MPRNTLLVLKEIRLFLAFPIGIVSNPKFAHCRSRRRLLSRSWFGRHGARDLTGSSRQGPRCVGYPVFELVVAAPLEIAKETQAAGQWWPPPAVVGRRGGPVASAYRDACASWRPAVRARPGAVGWDSRDERRVIRWGRSSWLAVLGCVPLHWGPVSARLKRGGSR